MAKTDTMNHTPASAGRRPSCSDAVRGMMFKDLPAKPAPDDKTFPVCTTHVDGPNCFYAQLLDADTMGSLEKLTTLLNETYEKPMAAFTPKINEICVAKFSEDGAWYRAIVMSYNADLTARVSFLLFITYTKA